MNLLEHTRPATLHILHTRVSAELKSQMQPQPVATASGTEAQDMPGEVPVVPHLSQDKLRLGPCSPPAVSEAPRAGAHTAT